MAGPSTPVLPCNGGADLEEVQEVEEVEDVKEVDYNRDHISA